MGLEAPEEAVLAVAPEVAPAEMVPEVMVAPVAAVPEGAVVPAVAAVPEAVEGLAAVPVEIDKANHSLTRK